MRAAGGSWWRDVTEQLRNQLRNLDLQYNRAFDRGGGGGGMGFADTNHPLERGSGVRVACSGDQRF